MYIPPNPDVYKDFQANLAGLQPQQLTTEEREALAARMQLQKDKTAQKRSIFNFWLRLIGRLSGLVTQTGQGVTPGTE